LQLVEARGIRIGDRSAVVDRVDPRPVERGHAHRAWFASCGDDRTIQEDIAGVATRFSDRINLGVRGDVGRQHDGVVRARQNIAIPRDRAAERALP